MRRGGHQNPIMNVSVCVCNQMQTVSSNNQAYHQYISKQWREFVVFIFNIVILCHNRGHGFTFENPCIGLALTSNGISCIKQIYTAANRV